MVLTQDDITRILAWWEFILEIGEDDADPDERDLVSRLRAHQETPQAVNE